MRFLDRGRFRCDDRVRQKEARRVSLFLDVVERLEKSDACFKRFLVSLGVFTFVEECVFSAFERHEFTVVSGFFH